METETWTIQRMLQWMEPYLADHGDENPRLAAQWLISDATGLARIALYTDLDRPLSAEELDLLRTNVKRRAAGEPLQYITGEAPFRHITVKVREGVLIPRPETEVLVSELLTLLPRPEKIRASEYKAQEMPDAQSELEPDGVTSIEASEDSEVAESEAFGMADRSTGSAALVEPAEPPRIKIADLCTGSGCIACALVHEHPAIDVVATDISAGALAVARENVDALGFEDRIKLIQCSLADGIVGPDGGFDGIISNPPYIPTAVLDALPSEVRDHEPRLALDGGTDGLDVFRSLLESGKRLLKPDGILAVELHETTLDDAARMAEGAGYSDVKIVRDLAQKPRVLIAYQR